MISLDPLRQTLFLFQVWILWVLVSRRILHLIIGFLIQVLSLVLIDLWSKSLVALLWWRTSLDLLVSVSDVPVEIARICKEFATVHALKLFLLWLVSLWTSLLSLFIFHWRVLIFRIFLLILRLHTLYSHWDLVSHVDKTLLLRIWLWLVRLLFGVDLFFIFH